MGAPQLTLNTVNFAGTWEQARDGLHDDLNRIAVFINQQGSKNAVASAVLASGNGFSTVGAVASLASVKLSGLANGDVLEVTASFHGVGSTAEGFNLFHQTDGLDLGSDHTVAVADAMCRWTLAASPRSPKQIVCTQFLPTDDGGIGLPAGCWRQQVVTVITDWTGAWTLSLRGFVTGGSPNAVNWQCQVHKL